MKHALSTLCLVCVIVLSPLGRGEQSSTPTLTLPRDVSKPITEGGKVVGKETIPAGTPLTVIKEYPRTYMVTRTNEHKPFFVEKNPEPETPSPNDLSLCTEGGMERLNAFLDYYDTHPVQEDNSSNFFDRFKVNKNDPPQVAMWKLIHDEEHNVFSRDMVPYISKLKEVASNAKKEGYYGPDENTKYYISLRPKFEEYGISIRRQMGGNCAIYAAASVLEYALAKAGLPHSVSIPYLRWAHNAKSASMLSPNGIRFQPKTINGKTVIIETPMKFDLNSDGGVLELAFYGVRTYGILPEEEMPLSKLRQSPSQETIKRARPINITITKCFVSDWITSPDYSEENCFRDIVIKDELRKGNPVAIGWLAPPDKPKTPFITETSWGLHGMVIVGFYSPTGKDEDTVYEVRNSWGKSWGDHGYCWIPSQLINMRCETFSISIN